MRLYVLGCLGLFSLIGGGPGLWGAEPPPAIGVGTTKAALLAAYGEPILHSRLGPREIFKYPQGQVILEEGRVVRLEFKAGEPPRLPPAAVKAAPPVARVTEIAGWTGDVALASQAAIQRSAPLLVWFSGSDWSGPSRQFREEVALQGDFVAAFQSRYVLLRVDLPDHNGTPRDPHVRLRERLGVTVYPTLLVLSPAGESLAKIDLSRPTAGETYAARVIAAVREMHDLLGFAPLPPAPGASDAPPATTAHRPVRAVTPGQVADSLLSAGWGLVSAVGTGLVVTLTLLWLLWRTGSRPGTMRRPVPMAERIAEAASGVPTLDQITAWSKERVVVVAAGLAEAEGFLTELCANATDGDADIRLRKAGEPDVQGLVCCMGAKAGVITAKRVRELFGVMTAEGAPQGWFVAPMGFSTEARMFADSHRIRLSDGPRLLAQLQELPPVELPKVVTRTPWVTA
ncbi:MAG: restriction endonuclease [Opitutaceae bacterium]|nr:restriction endonuclease [Opitutaceae bacterium]